LLLLTKQIFDFQNEHGFELLHSNSESCLQNVVYPNVNITPTEYFKIYQKYDLFVEIKKCIKKLSFLKKLNPVLNKYLENAEEKEQFKKFINMIVLINLIKQNIKNNSIVDINLLFNELNKINVDLLNYFNLTQLLNEPSLEQLTSFNNTYNYHSVSMFNLCDKIDDDTYSNIYELLCLFK
jgi:hypothetical protein